MDTLLEFLESHEGILGWTAIASTALFLITLLIVPVIVIRIPYDYFVKHAEPELPKTPLKVAQLVLRNLFGVIFLIIGIAMLVLPGPGLLTILLGISLLDFPAKRKAQARIVHLRSVSRTINWIRRRAHQPPLEFPER